MHRKIILFLTALLLVFTSILCIAADTPDTKDSQPTDFSKPISLGPDDREFSILLSENPSTGYRWYLVDYDFHYITPLERQYTPPTTKSIGAAGISKFRFQLKELAIHLPVTTNVEFEYRRAWENPAAKKQTITIVTQGE